MLIGTSFIASATNITDPTNDVWHWSQTGTAWSWTGNIENKPNIDITTVSGTINGVNLTLSITVAGTIQTSQKILYRVWCNTSDVSYNMLWSNNKGQGMVVKKGGGSQFVTNFTVSGNTISAVFKVIGNASATDLWGWAAEYTSLVNQTTHEWWGDWTPNSKIPFSISPGGNPGNNTGNNTGKKTPDFEVLPVVAAIAVAAVLLRRR
jgi:hypothetical protein